MGSENRRHRRVVMHQRAEISCRSEDSVITETVRITDISLGGAKVTANNAYPLSSIVKLEIHLPDDIITLIGSVRHVAKQPEPPFYDLGIKFIGLDDDELNKLRNALQRAENPPDKR